MKVAILLIAAVASLGFMSSANAALIPYPNVGTFAPAVTFQAASTGNITAYFYASDAGFDSKIGVLVNGVSTGVFGLPNHSSNHGDSIVLGSVNAGDTITFELAVISNGSSWYSDPSMNSDRVNHAYSTSFGGDVSIPAGTYVGFEDISGGGDIDYNDHQFVFTNVVSADSVPVPEPGTGLIFAGVLGLGLVLQRKKLRPTR